MNFVNESKTTVTKQDWQGPGAYGFDQAPKYLFVWSRLFQSVISQTITHMFTGKFHTQGCAIYKTEGGCNIPGVGQLVLCNSSCHFDTYAPMKEAEKKCIAKIAGVITHVVLNWDPNNPIESMLNDAASQIKVDVVDLRKAIEASTNGGPFGGNALADFFSWNPFSKAPIDRDYFCFCLLKYDNKTEAEVDEKFADEDLGEELLEKINTKIKSCPKNSSWTRALCCSPRRFEDKSLHFWINTGRTTVIDGWNTQETIQKFLESDGGIV